MKVFYSEAHRAHNPPFEIFEGGVKIPVFECPERMDRVLAALRKTVWAEIAPPEDFGLEPIRAVHADDYLQYLENAFADWKREGGQSGGPEFDSPLVMPATFPPRRWSNKRPTSLAGRSGFYTIDLNAPIVAETYQAALMSANCALSGAKAIVSGERVAFALCRPPGHHAGRDNCGGYCYLNNAAIAARWLSKHGKVAILDIDYHGGNGTQDIFYESAEVLTISIHADPNWEYPFFAGYADEAGAGAGLGYHRNFPLPPHTDDTHYLEALGEAIGLIRKFNPAHLVISAGMDIYKGDPLGKFDVTTDGIREIGQRIEGMGLPTLVVMEGGYNNEALGENVVGLLSAFAN
ncbi:MAG: histone deacetylase family protein [Chloroflexi bacterium]|nr:histone deacetylase family protein [Chloroflexota bacterium]